MEKEKISIVIPAYNVEKYIERTLESIITQTYNNIEIIIVNDGSVDKTLKKCQELINRDKRIKIYSIENSGQSVARNFGISKATGKYITFIDSDDYVDNDYIEYLYRLLKDNEAEISICSYKAIYPNGAIITQEDKNKKYILNSCEAIEKTLYHEDFNVSVWAKMYERKFFDTVKFPEGKIFEEVETVYKLFLQANKIAVGLESKYNYMIRNGSTLTGSFSEKKLYLIEAYKNMGKEVEKVFPNLKDAIMRANVYANISTLRQMIFCNPRWKDKEKEICEYIKNNYKTVLKNKRVAKRDKIACVLIRINTDLFKYGWFIYCKITGRKFY